MENAVGFAVKVWPPTVKIDGGDDLVNGIVELPTTRTPDVPRLTAVPARITAGPPAVTVVPATAKPELSAVIV